MSRKQLTVQLTNRFVVNTTICFCEKNIKSHIFIKMKEPFLAAKLECCKKTVVVPANFIYQLDSAKTFNNGINRNQVHLMFWSQNQTKQPNFNLPISMQFSSIDACFDVKIQRAFGMYNKYSCSRLFVFDLVN